MEKYTEDWHILNKKRTELIRKKLKTGLTKTEVKKLKKLQIQFDLRVESLRNKKKKT